MSHVNPHIFLFFHDGKIALWDYVNHEHYLLEKNYLDRLVEIATGSEPAELESACDTELLQSGVVGLEPFPEIAWGWGKVSEMLHFASKNFGQALSQEDESRYVNQYIDICAELYADVQEDDLRSRREGPVIQLPQADTDRLRNVSYWDALESRKTTRTFLGESIPLADLSLILYATFGEVHGRWSALEERGIRVLGIRKTSPSGGATHSCQAYVVALRVDGLSPGIYHYQSDAHTLVQISQVDCNGRLGRLLSGQAFANQLAAGVFITSRFDQVWVKYKHSRGYRVPFIDLGHLSQTFSLTANAIGLNTWLSGVFEDDEVSNLLGLEPYDNEQPLFFVGVGKGTGDPLHPKLVEAIEARIHAASLAQRAPDPDTPA